MIIVDIPNILNASKILFESGYLSKLAVRRLARDCQLLVNKAGEFGDSEAQKAVKDFSHWLFERI